MKRLAFVLLALCVQLMPVTAYAQNKEFKEVTVLLESLPDKIRLGDSIVLQASSEKHGSQFEDEWTHATKMETVYGEASSTYVARAQFTPTEPGSYEITYRIRMKAGKNGREFIGTVKKTILVEGSATIIGAVVKNVIVFPIMRTGQVAGYTVMGELYAVWSDGRQTDVKQVVSSVLRAEEVSKLVPFSFDVDGKHYQFMAEVSRSQ